MIRAPASFASRLRIAVLAGGQSTERSVSLASGKSVVEALAGAGHWVVGIDPVDSDLADDSARVAVDLSAARRAKMPFLPAPLRDVDWTAVDACFLALHGGAGEDGRVQRFFEDRQVPFTGPGSASAELAMSKTATKAALRAAGVPTAPDVAFDADTPLALLCQRAEALGMPVVVKPDGQGSSLGVGLARNRDELAACREEVLRYDARGLIEPFLVGREFTVSIVGREVLPALEVLAGEALFSFADKYTPGAAHGRVVDDLPATELEEIRRVALAAAAALNTRGLVRVDCRQGADGRLWVLEVNAIPGMTPTSLAPLAARHAGWELAEFCERLLRECLPGESWLSIDRPTPLRPGHALPIAALPTDIDVLRSAGEIR